MRRCPLSLAFDIAARLPVTDRLLLSCLSRAHRALVAEPGLWRVVDLSRGGVAPWERHGRFVCDGLLRAVAAKALGSVAVLDLSGWHLPRTTWHRPAGAVCGATWPAAGRGPRATAARAARTPPSWATLREVAAANARSLRRVRVLGGGSAEADDVVGVLEAAAPHLESLEADLQCTAMRAPALLLRREAPLRPLRVHRLAVGGPWAGEASVLALAAGLAAHPALTEAVLDGAAPLAGAAAAAALADAAAAGCPRLAGLHLLRCALGPASAPALARLLLRGALARLVVRNDGVRLLNDEVAPAFCAALRACRLTGLTLEAACVWDGATASEVLAAALMAHPTLASLDLSYNRPRVVRDAQVVGTALAALATSSRVLKELRVSDCRLGDAGVRPILGALLPGRCALRSLDCSSNFLSRAFARNELLPTVTLNVSLRSFNAQNEVWSENSEYSDSDEDRRYHRHRGPQVDHMYIELAEAAALVDEREEEDEAGHP